MKCMNVQQRCVPRCLVVSRAARTERTPVKKGAAVLLAMGAALVVTHSGPAEALSFTEKVEKEKKEIAEQSSRLEYLLEQQMNATKAGAKGKEEVRSASQPMRFHTIMSNKPLVRSDGASWRWLAAAGLLCVADTFAGLDRIFILCEARCGTLDVVKFGSVHAYDTSHTRHNGW